MPMRKLKEYLDSNNVKYSTIPHATAYTAQQTAQAAHISGKLMAKTLIVKLDGQLMMVVLTANEPLDFEKLKSWSRLKLWSS